MGREGLEPPYCKANTTICVQTGFTVQRRYLPGFAVARGIEPLFEPAMPPVLPLDDTTEKLLSHKVSLAAPPSFDYRVQTYQKHHTINASVPWALCGFVPYPGIGPGYSQTHSGQLVCLHHLMTASYYQGLLHRYVISLAFSILQPFHMAKVSKCFEPARKPQLVLCVRPTVVDTGGI